MKVSTSAAFWGKVIFILGALLQAGWFALLWVRYISQIKLHPEVILSADFSALYTAGKIARIWGYPFIFEISLERQIQENLTAQILPEILIFNHPPMFVQLLKWLAGFDYSTAYILWSIFLGFIATTSVYILIKSFYSETRFTGILFFAGVLFHPILVCILTGQDSMFVLLGCAILVYGIKKDNPIVSGLGLMLTIIRPNLTLGLALPFLFKGQKTFKWFFFFTTLLGIYLLSIVTIGGAFDLFGLIIKSVEGQGIGFNEPAMFNLLGILVRSMPPKWLNSIHSVSWGIYGAGIIFNCIYWRTRDKASHQGLAVMIISVLFTSPHLHYHDLAVLLIPVALFASGFNAKLSPHILLGISLILTLSRIASEFLYEPINPRQVGYHSIHFIVLYIILLGLGNFFWKKSTELRKI